MLQLSLLFVAILLPFILADSVTWPLYDDPNSVCSKGGFDKKVHIKELDLDVKYDVDNDSQIYRESQYLATLPCNSAYDCQTTFRGRINQFAQPIDTINDFQEEILNWFATNSCAAKACAASPLEFNQKYTYGVGQYATMSCKLWTPKTIFDTLNETFPALFPIRATSHCTISTEDVKPKQDEETISIHKQAFQCRHYKIDLCNEPYRQFVHSDKNGSVVCDFNTAHNNTELLFHHSDTYCEQRNGCLLEIDYHAPLHVEVGEAAGKDGQILLNDFAQTDSCGIYKKSCRSRVLVPYNARVDLKAIVRLYSYTCMFSDSDIMWDALVPSSSSVRAIMAYYYFK